MLIMEVDMNLWINYLELIKNRFYEYEIVPINMNT